MAVVAVELPDRLECNFLVQTEVVRERGYLVFPVFKLTELLVCFLGTVRENMMYQLVQVLVRGPAQH